MLPSGDIVYSQYAHMRDTPLVVFDQQVCMGEPLGFVGNTGFSVGATGYHLHFEIKDNTLDSDGPGYIFDGSINGYYNPLDFVNSNFANLPPCKSLARIEGQNAVYWLQNRKAYHILSFDIINNMSSLPGWGNDEIWEYAENVLDICQQDGGIPEESFRQVQDFITTGADSNYLLIRLQGDSKIYMIKNGQRHHITSAEVFDQLGYDFNDVIVVTQAILDLIPEGDPISSAVSNIDTSLIIDSSGSMAWNDPHGLRKEAAEIFVGMAQNEDQIAIIDFDSGAYVRWSMQPLTDDRDGIKAAINSINSSSGTNIGRGLLSGYYELISSSEPNKKAAVLLTDGDGSYYNQAALYKDEGWPIYTVGLGSSVNTNLLNNIANETGGKYFALNDANQLKNVYFEIANQITGGVSLFGQTLNLLTGDFHELLVNIPLYQEFITFLISWPGSDVSTALTTPSGKQITPQTVDSDVYHAKGLTYELYRITNPEAGEWAVGLTGVDLSPAGEEVSLSVSGVGQAEPVDTTPPVISIANPVNGKTYFDQLATNFSFMIEDPESAITSQSALLNGNPINNNDSILLTQLGENTLTITATNEADLTSEQTVTFYVNHFHWLSPMKYEKKSDVETETLVLKADRTYPIKFTAENKDGNFAIDQSVKVIVEGTTAEFLFGDTDVDVRINEFEEDGEPTYIVNLHTNLKKWDYQMEVDGEYWITVYFDTILAAKTKLVIE